MKENLMELKGLSLMQNWLFGKVKIYLVNTTSQYYASSLVDLIEQIIPKISREFYNNTQKIKNVECSICYC